MTESDPPLITGAANLPRRVRAPGGGFYGLLGNPLAQLERFARMPDDVVMFRQGGERFYFIKSPPLIHEVLVTKGRHFAKGRSLERLRKIIGNGLLTSSGDFYLRQRRLMQPLFHAQRVRDFSRTMVDHATALMEDWRDGEPRDLSHDMMRLTLGIVSQTLLGSDVDSHAAKVRETMDTFLRTFPVLMLPFAEVLEHLPIPAIKRLRKVRDELDDIVYRLIDTRRRQPKDNGDLLSMLLAAQDPEGQPGEGMTDQQVHDEVMIIFLAGHETTATAFSWLWFLLAQHPAVEAEFHAELDRVLADKRLPTADDFGKLTYTRQVVNEAMRIYPPVWTIARRAQSACEIGGYDVPERTIVLMSQWIVHRDAKLFEEPLQFRPERWTPQFEASLPKISYFPFGGGLRRCIGEGFAWMEIVLVLATIGHRWRFHIENPAMVVPKPLFTLRLKNGLPVTLRRREAAQL